MRALIFLSCIFAFGLRAADLEAYSEFARLDPFGVVIEADRPAGQPLSGPNGVVALRGARGGYVSFRLAARLSKPGPYSVTFAWNTPATNLTAEAFREWFHYTEPKNSYYPDALAPVKLPYRSQLPEPDNRIEKQTVQTFWVDIWIPRDTAPGVYRGEARIEGDGKKVSRRIELQVLPASIPEKEIVAIDHNSYGSEWLSSQYPKLRQRLGEKFFASDEFFGLIHSYHRIFYEHLGVFHQLGYGHGGKVGPEFAPELDGSGRTKRIKSWSLYDRHYGPLLDGSAFAGTRRGAQPIPFVYLPINPEWPASFLWWGEPGYETEFVNVVREMEQHFRDKGWTKTAFEMFFNHKKRYKAFPWDGDETRFPNDNRYFAEYARLLKKAVPPGSQVHFRFRSDSSWMMGQQFKELAGVIDFWVLGGSELSWYKEVPAMLRARGDIVWMYGGTPEVTESSGAITFAPFQTWIWGAEGFVRWLTVSPGADPWFRFGGGDTVLAYSGDRFAIDGPIPSVRLKLQRNCVQDLTLLDSLKTRKPFEELRAGAASRYNSSRYEDWWPPRPAAADLPPYEMTNATIAENSKPVKDLAARVDAQSWEKVRVWILQLAVGGK
ncbi:MAG TPA: hypothetical protein VLE22_05735 [Bryobacteraceae bacterium]|nr:hypothetical protein [Bryobacteraceae bacterium]